MSARRNDCEQLEALIGAYSLGITDPDETRLVESLLADCPEVAQELEDYFALAVALHEAAPMRYQAPPASRILAGFDETAPVRRQPAAPQNITPLAQPSSPRRHTWWLGVAALVAVTILAVGSNLLWFDRVNELEEALQATTVARPTPHQPFNIALRSEDVHQSILLPTDAGRPDARARVIWNSEIEVGSLFVTGLDPLPPDMAYQLWVVRKDETLSLGQFHVDDTGTGIMIFQSPEPIANFDAMGISPEPATGSAKPTHEHVVVGKI